MPMRFKRKVILFKNEGTAGQDAAPVAATNAILVRNFRMSFLDQEGDDRDFDVTYVGNKGRLLSGATVKFDFDVEMAGSGAAGTAPGYGPLLKACAMSETVNAGVSVVYAPVNPGSETTGTLYFYLDGRLHKAVYCLGNVTPKLSRGKAPLYAFSFIGIYVAPTDVALVSPTLSAFQKPLVVNNANTTPVTVHGFAGKFSEIQFSSGNVLTYRNLVGSESVRFTDRDSRGSVKLEDELVATKDWWTIMRAGTLGAMSVTHGTVAGNKVVLAAPNVQLLDPGSDAEDNIAMLSMNMLLTATLAGNDEFSITVQ
ncbi:MAG: hypothetical protein A3I63_01955 [Betaproteobacteria bacterium RIFCSPLOWO2_02_FULL_66_14]|nr:MAG: hypothetical protein A3I63_01955 [Betaproteobacteria bacterium RIFCSPLOWO2_02_FULL_66_14]